MEVDKLPSLVKVTPRPIRHPAMQPSSNLILKAVAEAQKSIATSSLPQPDDKVIMFLFIWIKMVLCLKIYNNGTAIVSFFYYYNNAQY